MDNNGCPSHGWSIITSASANSQLAGVLAGFLFSGIVILFSLKGQKCTKALSLFCATFIVLGFTSYLFNLVSGDTADPYCTRVWAGGMAASGMFGVGAAGLFSGICWLLSVHIDAVTAQQDDTEQDVPATHSSAQHAPRLELVGSLMVHGTNVIASLLLARTAFDYLGVVYEQQASWVVDLWQWVYAVPAVVACVALTLTWYRTRRRSRRSSPRSGDSRKRLTLFTVYGVLAYGILGTIFAGALTNLPDSLWPNPPLLLVTATIAIELLVPGALIVGLVLAVPFLDRPEQESDATCEHNGKVPQATQSTPDADPPEGASNA